MKDTPRTNAKEWGYVVSSSFARELELENNLLRETVNVIGESRGDVARKLDALAQSTAQWLHAALQLEADGKKFGDNMLKRMEQAKRALTDAGYLVPQVSTDKKREAHDE